MDRWVDQVEVGNAYVNRVITGAIVRRQPFGGWKRSVVGPGAKAGGPNYVTQLGTWTTTAAPRHGIEPRRPVRDVLSRLGDHFDDSDMVWLRAAAASDAYWWDHEFSRPRDESGLLVEANDFRYVPRSRVVVRVGAGAGRRDVARTILASLAASVRVELSTPEPLAGMDAGGVPVVIESEQELIARLPRWSRIRLVGAAGPNLLGLAAAAEIDVIDLPVVANGHHEIRWYLREQAISRTLHRFGNLVGV